MTNRVLKISDVALLGDAKSAPYTPYGYIIDAEARIYALTRKWCHGVVLAILYPELAKQQGFAPPDIEADQIDVFAYQRFELDNSAMLPVIRVAQSQLTDEVMIANGETKPTEAQLTALLAVLKQMGLRGTDSLTGDEDGTTVNELLQRLRAMGLTAAIAEPLDLPQLRSPFIAGDEKC